MTPPKPVFACIREQIADGLWSEGMTLCHGLPAELTDLPEAQRYRQTLAAVLEGNALLEREQPADAVRAYRSAIVLMPEAFRIHNLLGNAYLELGDYPAAENAYRQAARLKPDYAPAHCNIGTALLAGGNARAALSAVQHALTIAPGFGPAMDTLADILIALDRRDEAIATLNLILEKTPENLYAVMRLGDLLSTDNRHADAATLYQRALGHFPEDADLLEKMAQAQMQLRQFETSLATLNKALQLYSHNASLHNNKGCVLERLNRYPEAIEEYLLALEIDRHDTNTLNNISACLLHLQRPAEALTYCLRAQALTPDALPVLKNLANIHLNLGNTEVAIATYRHAISIYPGEADLFNNLGMALDSSGLPEEGLQQYRAALALRPGDFSLWSNALFAQSMLAANDPTRYVEEAREFGKCLQASLPAPYADWPCADGKMPTRLRVGLVSGDFKQHPVGYFLESTLDALTGMPLDLIAFNTEPNAPDALGERIRGKTQGWHDIEHRTPLESAELVRSCGIHILIDLSGHTAHNALGVFALKPAPVQISWLGYWASTGLPEIDYFLTDPVSSPAGDENQFTETLWRLPHTRFCFSAPMSEPAMPVMPPPSLNNGFITFGCFQRLNKLNEETLGIWARVLTAIPNARLLLKGRGFDSERSANQLRKRLLRYAISPERILLEGSSLREDYLRSYNRVDVMLDTYPFPGGTTTCEALWMGVPTLTLTGSSLITRQGASLLSAAGLPDWVSSTPDELVSKALALCAHPERLTLIRAHLRRQLQESPLMNAALFAHDFESALRSMWKQFLSKRRTPEQGH